MPTIYGYVRCSHINSAESGLGLEAQEKAIRAYIRHEREMDPLMQACRVGDIYRDEAKSAYRYTLRQRTAGLAMCEALIPGDHVVFDRLDRAFRSLRDAMNMTDEWQKTDVTVHFVKERLNGGTAMGRFGLQIMAAMAELDSAIKSERIRDALQMKRARSESTGGRVEIGKQVKRRGQRKLVVADPACQRVMRLIAHLYQGGMSFGALVDPVERYWAKHECRSPNFSKPKWCKGTIWRAYHREIERVQIEENEADQYGDLAD